MRLCWKKLCVALSCAVLLSGCGGTPVNNAAPTKAPSTASEEEGGGVKVVDGGIVSKLQDYLPKLDGGRIEVAAPQDWKPLSRDNAHLVRFIVQGNDANNLPRILLVASEAGALPDPVTADNVLEFTAAIAEELAEKKGIEEKPKAMVIGDNAFVRYVSLARKGERVVKRQVLETVQGGRRYALTLEVYNSVDPTNRDLAYAVAAGLKFHGTDAPAPTPPTEATPPVETPPVEAPPTEEKPAAE